MAFKRDKLEALNKWRKKKDRKPLILNGARQVGKTTLVKSFGEAYESITYFNFEKQKDIHEFFKATLDPQRIIKNLGLIQEQPIKAELTLIFFEEIQACPEAITSLKYFQEEASEYHVIAAGSLLGVSLNNVSFPVGKVEVMDLYPMTYSEFLQASNSKLYTAYNSFAEEKTIQRLPEAFFNPMMESFKEYIVCGGMPEVVRHYIKSKDLNTTTEVKRQLIETYTRDFSNHIDTNKTALKVRHVWDSLPSQLARDNKKFVYNVARKGARAREYEEALDWLNGAGLVIKASNVTVPRLPLKAYNELSAFKLYLLDVGLLFAMSDLDPRDYIVGNRLLTEFKGALTENYIAQALRAQGVRDLHYWTSEGKAEVDFLLPNSNVVIPIEVKSGQSTKAQSLKVYKKNYDPDLSIMLSAKNFSFDGKNLHIPLFYADRITKLIEKTRK